MSTISSLQKPIAPPIQKETTVGNYFVSNYPPFSFWKPESVPDILAALEKPPTHNYLSPDASRPSPPPLGIYLHIPFCRKRCHFCYFKVYTDKDSTAIRAYIDAALKELSLYAQKPVIGGRNANFVYFGGGTPSYLSVDQLKYLTDGMKKLIPWNGVEEVTFECEPGTLTDHKLKAIREMGVTRLSLGIENFSDHILEINGRAHRSKEVYRAYNYAREINFPQINIDLIAGMVEETEENWRDCVAKTIALSPDSVTIYQMEIPYNTTIYQEMKAAGKLIAPVADWETKRNWVKYAFAELEKNGYTVGSAYTAVKTQGSTGHWPVSSGGSPDEMGGMSQLDSSTTASSTSPAIPVGESPPGTGRLPVPPTKFIYRDKLWAGADLLSLGVASFGHFSGTHYQNHHEFETYVTKINQGELPIFRALTPNDDERLIREFVLQLKLGHVSCEYFQKQFGVDVRQRFAAPLQTLSDWGFGKIEGDTISLNRDGLLQVDRLLHEFFLPQHKNARYA
ncbi:MAG: coproporphyrinogen III oxidase family protein [Verrucomicrobiota bacterium]|nr:coproporphyrinogen III oxidase family protein [Verrucomicrobiota bacterium]